MPSPESEAQKWLKSKSRNDWDDEGFIQIVTLADALEYGRKVEEETKHAEGIRATLLESVWKHRHREVFAIAAKVRELAEGVGKREKRVCEWIINEVRAELEGGEDESNA